MNRTTAHITDLSVPTDDGGIAAALTGLDEKLNAWFEAMRDAQRQISEAAEQAAATAVAQPPSAAEAQPSPQPETPAVADDATVPAEPSVPDGSAVAVASTDQPVDTQGPSAKEAVTEPVQSPLGGPAASVPSAAEDPTASPTNAEDEALLASLDPETAKAIRVMRRLSMVPVTVKELLREYETGRANPSEPEKPKRKSWFSKG